MIDSLPAEVRSLSVVPLPRSFYRRPVRRVASDLLGCVVVRRLDGPGGRPFRLAGRIVEVEAYDGPRDRACHAARGRTERTDPMFGEAGHAYIYLVYGMYCCLNVVTGPVGYPAAVLIRAIEPLEGVERMEAARLPAARAGSGPGRLTRALRITRALNRADLCAVGPLYVANDAARIARRLILTGPRIGVDYAGAWALRPWRFGVAGSPALSRPFPAKSGQNVAVQNRVKVMKAVRGEQGGPY